MIWFSIPLILLAGFARYLEGASKTEIPWKANIPSGVFRVLIALCTGMVAYLASSMYLPSIVVGVCGAVTISAGYTHWQSMTWQLGRGLIPGLIVSALLCGGAWLSYWPYPSLWGLAALCGLYTAAYVIYYCTENGNGSTIHPPVGDWEKWCRWLQAMLICGSGLFV